MGKDWIKLHCNRWLYGSTRDELTPAQRAVWIDLLALAGQLCKDDQDSMTLKVTRPALTRLFKVSRTLLDSTLEACQEANKLTLSEATDEITITNWAFYNPPRMTIAREALREHVTECSRVLPDVPGRSTLLPRDRERDRKRKRDRDQSSPVEEPNIADTSHTSIFDLYEQNIGPLSPLIAEQLKEAQAQYPLEWLEAAFKEAVSHNKRSWRYISAILERWGREGKDSGNHTKQSKGEVDPARYFKGRYGHVVRR